MGMQSPLNDGVMPEHPEHQEHDAPMFDDVPPPMDDGPWDGAQTPMALPAEGGWTGETGPSTAAPASGTYGVPIDKILRACLQAEFSLLCVATPSPPRLAYRS